MKPVPTEGRGSRIRGNDGVRAAGMTGLGRGSICLCKAGTGSCSEQVNMPASCPFGHPFSRELPISARGLNHNMGIGWLRSSDVTIGDMLFSFTPPGRLAII